MKVSKIVILKEWCKKQPRFFSSAEVNRWGVDNFYMSAARRVREFAEPGGFLRRVPDDEAKLRGLIRYGANISWYEVKS